MNGPLFNRVAILGLGLIGGSLARAMAEKNLAAHIAAYDKSHSALEWAQAQGFVHSHYPYAGDAAEKADLIIFATPPLTFQKLAQEIAPVLKNGAILSDVGSVKRAAIAAIAPEVPAHAFFVPGHPIAGGEQSGVQAGSAALFSGKRVALTPEERDVMSEPVARVRALWEGAGAKIDYMPAALHDHMYAYVSHLPQLVAFACGDAFPRLAKSGKALWADICLANADFIGEALGDFTAFGAQMAGELSHHSDATPVDGGISVAEIFPGVIASCLIATASLLEERIGVNPARYAGSGFAEMTAPAKGNPDSVLAAISAHHQEIAALLRTMLQRLHAMQDALARGDRARLLEAFSG